MSDIIDYRPYMVNDHKVYVHVIAYHAPGAPVTPLYILDEENVRRKVIKVTDIRRAASLKAGGAGLRYTVVIEGEMDDVETFMWLEESRTGGDWFITKG